MFHPHNALPGNLYMPNDHTIALPTTTLTPRTLNALAHIYTAHNLATPNLTGTHDIHTHLHRRHDSLTRALTTYTHRQPTHAHTHTDTTAIQPRTDTYLDHTGITYVLLALDHPHRAHIVEYLTTNNLTPQQLRDHVAHTDPQLYRQARHNNIHAALVTLIHRHNWRTTTTHDTITFTSRSHATTETHTLHIDTTNPQPAYTLITTGQTHTYTSTDHPYILATITHNALGSPNNPPPAVPKR